MIRLRILLGIMSVGLILAPAARAQDKAKGEEIVDNFVKATGGKAAYEKIHNVVAKGTVELAGVGLRGPITIYQAEPNKMYTEINFGAQFGKIEQGTDGQVFWENNTVQGAR